MASDVEVVQNVLKDLIGHVCEEVDYISDDENSFYEWDFHELVETGTLPPDELYRVLEDYYLTTDHHYHWKRTPLTADSPPEGAYSRLGNARFSVHHSFYTPSYLRVGDGKIVCRCNDHRCKSTLCIKDGNYEVFGECNHLCWPEHDAVEKVVRKAKIERLQGVSEDECVFHIYENTPDFAMIVLPAERSIRQRIRRVSENKNEKF